MEAVFVPVTVMLEAGWVLRSAYAASPADVVRALRGFAGLPTVSVEDAAPVAAALDLAESGTDFADALHASRSGGCEAFATFDRRLVQAARDAGRAGVRDA